MKNKRLVFLGVFTVLIVGAIFFLRDTSEVNEKEMENSINQRANESINQLNDDTFGDDINFDDIEEAPLALDTTKAEK